MSSKKGEHQPPKEFVGVYKMETFYQEHIKEFVSKLPKRADAERKYLEDLKAGRLKSDHVKNIDRRPYTASALGRDKKAIGGDFSAIAAVTWALRFESIEDERPQHDAFQRAQALSKSIEDKANEAAEKRRKELKAKAAVGLSDVAEGVLEHEYSAQTATRRKAPPDIYKPFKWDPINPMIPWPEIEPAKEVYGPAFDRIEGTRNVEKRKMDPFTGTWIVPKADINRRATLPLNYDPDKNAYVAGDVLSGLRSKKRHTRITSAEEYLKETKMSKKERDLKRKSDEKNGAEAEAAKAAAAVRERRLFSKQMQEKLRNMELKSRSSGGMYRARTAAAASTRKTPPSDKKLTLGGRTRLDTVDNGDAAPKVDVLILDDNFVSSRSSAADPSRPNTADRIRSISSSIFAAGGEDDDDIEDFWGSIRARTPTWATFRGNSRSGAPSSAGQTPGAALTRPRTAETSSGWFAGGNWRNLLSRGGDNDRLATTDASTPETPSVAADEKSCSAHAAAENQQQRTPGGGNSSENRETLRGRSRRSKRDGRAESSLSTGLGTDAALTFVDDEGSVGSMDSGKEFGSIGSDSVMTEDSFEFLNDSMEEGSDAKSAGSKSPKKVKTRKGSKRSSKIFVLDDDDSASMMSGPPSASTGGSSLGDSSTIASLDTGRARKKKKTKKKRDQEGSQGHEIVVTSFEFVDDLSLASSFGTNKDDSLDFKRNRRSSTSQEPDTDSCLERTTSADSSSVSDSHKSHNPSVPEMPQSANSKALTTEEKQLQAKEGSQKPISFFTKKGQKVERFLLRHKILKKPFTRKEFEDQGSGFRKESEKKDPFAIIQDLAAKIESHAIYIGVKVYDASAIASYSAVYLLAGREAANSMSLSDLVFRKTLSGDDMVAAAADAERITVARALNQKLSRISIDARDPHGRTSLICAVESCVRNLDDIELRDWQKSQKAQKRVRFLRGGEIEDSVEKIRAAREKAYTRMIDLLIAKGADVNAQMYGSRDENMSSLHIASAAGSVSRVKFLLWKKANINAGTENNTTALHFAAKNGHIDVAVLLLKNDANMGAKTDIGWTPLFFAAVSGGTSMVKFLLTAGSSKLTKDKEGRTATDIAKKYGNRSTFELLRKWCEPSTDVRENIEFLASKIA